MQFCNAKVEEVGNHFFFDTCIVFFLILEYYMEKEKKELKSMSKKKKEEERAWKARKENQKPHGKVKAFAELVEGTEKT